MLGLLLSIAPAYFIYPADAADLSGQSRIVDGDTIWIGKTKVRQHGIDTPEMRQECKQADGSAYRWCGEASTNALRVLVASEPVRCEGNTFDRYKRLIAVCYSGTVNLNAELVRQGGRWLTDAIRKITSQRRRKPKKPNVACGLGNLNRRGSGGGGRRNIL